MKQQVTEATQRMVAEFGNPNILVNNAAVLGNIKE